MNLGQKVSFQNELIKGENRRTPETEEYYQRNPNTTGARNPTRRNWGVRNNGKVMEGIICGKRRIDLDGWQDSEGYYEFNNSETVYLVATDMRGFHRVPESFII